MSRIVVHPRCWVQSLWKTLHEVHKYAGGLGQPPLPSLRICFQGHLHSLLTKRNSHRKQQVADWEMFSCVQQQPHITSKPHDLNVTYVWAHITIPG